MQDENLNIKMGKTRQEDGRVRNSAEITEVQGAG